jgi:serine/threonine-protein kinase HipA
MGRGVVKTSRVVTLNVLMNGHLVGYLRKLPNGAMAFQYAKAWLETPGGRPVSLSLPLQYAAYEGDQVYNFFDNLLPDSAQIRARIQARFKISTHQPFDLLAAIGADCVGAIQLCQEEHLSHRVDVTTAQVLTSSEIATLLKNYRTVPLGMTEAADDFRISIAGAQEKTALLWYQDRWCRPTGATPTSHIFKLPISFIDHNGVDLRDSCENEWLCLKIAEQFGFATANAQIQQFEEVKILVVERFDRRWSRDGTWLMRLPQEDMCQALGVSPNLKYQSDGGPGIVDIMQILLGSRKAEVDRETFFRSQVLFWLLAATDGHAKNFSLYIEPSGSYCLTPLYDVMSVYPLMQAKTIPRQKAKMAMALRGTSQNHYLWSKIQLRHFLATAKASNFSQKRAKQILSEMLEQVDGVATQVLEKLPEGFPPNISGPILQGMTRLAKQQLELMEAIS